MDTPSAETIGEALGRALESPSFVRSARLSRFLRFVVEKTLAGQEDALKEYTIGVEVFDRNESFDPRVETIVRVEARRLRNQLSEYYGDAGKSEEIRIEIPKGGYRPVFHTVHERSAERAEAPLDPRTVVVLPFEDMSPARDQAYFCEGITEEITHALAQVDGLKVISRTSAFSFKSQATEIRTIGRKLGAGTALEGSVRTSETKLRITAQLINATDGRHLWSKRFDIQPSDVFDAQDEVTDAVVRELAAALDEAPPLRRPSKRSRAPNQDAHNSNAKARYYMYQYTRESVAAAVRLFEQSIAEDDQYAQPWAGLAEAHAVNAILGWVPSADVMPLAKRAAIRALEIDEGVAEARASLALVLFRHDYDWDEAEKEYRRAMKLCPGAGTIRIWYASFLVFRHRSEEAITQAKRSAALDPLSVEAQRVVADTFFFCRRYSDAIEECRRIRSHHPGYYFAHFYEGMARLARDEPEDGLAALERADQLASGLPLTRAVLGWALGRTGHDDRARDILDELLEKRESGYFPAFFIAMVYVGLGQPDRAFEWLDTAYTQRDPLLPVLEVDPMWDPLRKDPRCAALLDRMSLG